MGEIVGIPGALPLLFGALLLGESLGIGEAVGKLKEYSTLEEPGDWSPIGGCDGNFNVSLNSPLTPSPSGRLTVSDSRTGLVPSFLAVISLN